MDLIYNFLWYNKHMSLKYEEDKNWEIKLQKLKSL